MAGLSLNLDTPHLARLYEDASSERQFKAGKLLVKKLGLRPGDRVLDVGGGTGLLAEYVAGIVGTEGSVVAIDPLPLRSRRNCRVRAAPSSTGSAMETLAEVSPCLMIKGMATP